MRNVKWNINGNQYILKSTEEVLVKLTIEPGINPVFTLNEVDYVFSHKGFWNPSFFIHDKQKEIVKITHSLWGSNGKLDFNDGTVFISTYSNKGNLSLTFLQEENEILKYEIVFNNKKPVLQFTIGTSIIDADKVLILAATGMIMFSTIYKEIASGGDTSSTSFITSLIASN
jgi:hypothetical protein